MTEKEARRLLIGTIVMQDRKESVPGTVRVIHPRHGVYVDWENNKREWLGYDQVNNLSIWCPS